MWKAIQHFLKLAKVSQNMIVAAILAASTP